MDVAASTVSNRKGKAHLGGGLSGPGSFTVEVGVSDGGEPTMFKIEVAYIDDSYGYGAVSLHVTAPKGGRVTPDILRGLPLQEKVKEAVLMSLPRTDIRSGPTTTYTLSGGQRVIIDRESVANGPTDGALREVANLYRVAHGVGDPPTQTISKAFGLPSSTAARWIGKARDKGYLGPAMRGRSSA